MVESIKELRKICQNPKDLWQFRYFLVIKQGTFRSLSIYITRLLLYTSVNANQVTMFVIMLGFVVGYLFSIGNYWYAILAAVVSQFAWLMDVVDGEIARYRKASSINGLFLDLILHITNITLPFVGITIGLYKLNPGLDIVVLGLFASVFSIGALDIQALKYHALFRTLIDNSKKKLYKPQSKIIQTKTPDQITSNFKKKIFRKFINPLYDHFLIITFIFIGAVFNKLYWVLLFYGLTFPIIWLIKLIHEYRVGSEPYEYLLKLYKK